MIKQRIIRFLSKAAPELVQAGYHRFSTPTDAKISEGLAEKYGKIADEMRERGGPPKPESKPEVNPAEVYRKRLESGDSPCGICIEMLKRMEDLPLNEQVEGVTAVGEAEGAARAGADVDELKRIMKENDVLRNVLVNLKED